MSKFVPDHKEKRLWWIFGALFAAFAVFLRFYLLDNKPIHFDESINMWFVQRIWEDGFFRYDPTNYHGPLLFYLIQAVQLFTGFDFISTRIVASVFSVLTVLLLWWGPKPQRQALRWAAGFLLLSPAMGFYGRSGIHESGFVFFQVLAFLSFHFLVAKDYPRFWRWFGAGLFGMMAMKETFVISILAWIPAAVFVLWRQRRHQPSIKNDTHQPQWALQLEHFRKSLQNREVAVPLAAMLILFLGLYSGFGANPGGIADFFVALIPWLKTGVHGNGHEKSFWHWAELMGKYEFATIVGFAAALVQAAFRKNTWILYYGIFAFFNWLIYSLIPYKTPWCLISILWPFAIVAGFGMQQLFSFTSTKKWLGVLATLIFALLLLGQSTFFYQVQFQVPIDMEHPYVYVNTTYEMKDFMQSILKAADQNPLLRERPLQVATKESWPLPIVFHSFANLSYQKVAVEIMPNALVYFVDEVDRDTLESGLSQQKTFENYEMRLLSVRQGRAAIYAYVQKSLVPLPKEAL